MPAPAPTRSVRRCLLVALVLALVAAACTDDEGDPDGEATSSTLPAPQTLLRVGVETWPECLNPITCDSPALREQILQHVLPVIFEVDSDGRYRPSPLLAAEPEAEVVGDGMTVTYRLDPDAAWNDGQPVTSTDIRGTWQAILATPGADRAGYDRIVSIDDRDPLVAVATFASPYADWRELFGAGRGWVLRADALGEDLDVSDEFADELPFSAAPYRLGAWDDGAAVLAAVDEHWATDRRPAIDQVRLTHVTVEDLEAPERFDVLVPEGELDEVPTGFDRRTVPSTTVLGIWFDQRTPLLADPVHRQALASALDRDELVGLVPGAADEPVPCLGWVPGVGPWCEEAAVELPEHAPDLAAFGLATAGWVPVEGSSVRVRDGQPFSMPLTHDPDVPGAADVADAAAEAFVALGVNVEASEVETSTWAGPRPVGESTGVGVFARDLGVSAQVLDLYGCPAGLDSSALGWCPPGIVAGARTLVTALDAERQAELVASIGAEAGAAVAWVPLVRVPDVVHLQGDRVSLPEAMPLVGGPLAGLRAFTLDS